MSLEDLITDLVDVLRIDDAVTGNRMGRGQARTVLANGVACRINEQGPSRTPIAGHDGTLHSHRVHFLTDPGVNVGNLLRETGTQRHYAVVGTRKPASPRMPWVAYCQRTESAA